MEIRIEGVDHVAFAGADQAASIAWYRDREVDHDTAHSLYFEDPDGAGLELTTYELG